MNAKIPSAVKDEASIAARLLDWYDRNRRVLPWRALPGEEPNPYHVWLSEIMLQQTTVATVRPRFVEFVTRWPSVEALAAADDAELMSAWAGLGYYARARNLLACARIVATDHGGRFPQEEGRLRALPGVGAYTAAAIAAIAFGKRAVVIDANVERVVARLFALATPMPAAKPEIQARTALITPDARAGDFAQAMMDLGAGICTPRNPRCASCPLHPHCRAGAGGDPAAYPPKPARAAKPHRYGTAFWLERDECILLVRRPPKGLLGGMRALPTGPWQATPPGLAGAPAQARWRIARERVNHVFTHFTFELALAVAEAGGHSPSHDGEWWPIDDLESAGLPTVFVKATRLEKKS